MVALDFPGHVTVATGSTVSAISAACATGTTCRASFGALATGSAVWAALSAYVYCFWTIAADAFAARCIDDSTLTRYASTASSARPSWSSSSTCCRHPRRRHDQPGHQPGPGHEHPGEHRESS